MVKMKVVDKFNAVRAMLRGEVVEGFTLEDAQAFLAERIEIAVKKNASNGERKPTKVQVANEGIKTEILQTLADIGCPATIDNMQKANESLAPYSGQKLTALISQLVKAEKVVRTEVKGKAHFELALATEE